MRKCESSAAVTSMTSSPQVLTFLDAGVLFSVFSAQPGNAARALAVLADPARSFVTSDVLELEVLPKPIYFKRTDQADYYRAYFNNAALQVEASKGLLEAAFDAACLYGLAAVDALHVTAALVAGCHELITTEKQTKPIYRVPGLTIHYLADL